MATGAAAGCHHPVLVQRGRRLGGVRCSSPGHEFGALAEVFRRRLVVGATTAAAAAVGANFGGITNFLLGLSSELGRSLRLDVLYPVGGFTRCLDSDSGLGYLLEKKIGGKDKQSLEREVSNFVFCAEFPPTVVSLANHC